MAGTIVADQLEAASTSTLVIKNGVANTPPTIQDSAGTQIGTFCRAWVNFNGATNTGGFCTISASFNVTSVADNGTGQYTVNFTNALPDANYSVQTSCIATAVNAPRHTQYNTLAVGSVVVYSCDTAGGASDPTSFSVAIFD
jgi:hypothetical protein